MLNKILLSLIISVMLWFPITDADIGWHLRYGDYFWATQKLIETNTFSWALPDFSWANHSWGYDVVVSKLYAVGGFTLLSVTGALFIGLSAWLLLPATHLLASGIIAVLFIYINSELLNTGLKSHYLTFLFTAILLKGLQYTAKVPTPKAYPFFALLIVLWSNFHGQFSLGIAFVLVYVLIAKSSYWWRLSLLVLLASLVNPWGHNLWLTASTHLSAPTLTYIFEWMPLEWHRPLTLVYLAYLIWIAWNCKSSWRHPSPYLICFALVVGLSLKARRFIPLAMLLSLHITPQLLAPKLPFGKIPARLITLGLAIILITLTLFKLNQGTVLFQNWDTYCASYLACSSSAAQYLNANPPQGRLFNAYGLGSFLIYHSPSIPVYIDGRMTVWHDNSGHYPFTTYYDVIHAKTNVIAWLTQNRVEYVLIQPQFELAQTLAQYQWPIAFSDTQVVLFTNPFFK